MNQLAGNLTTDSRLSAIAETVENGQRVSFDDGLYLDQHADLLFLGHLANTIRERKNGNLAFYNTNIHLNPTNVCVYRCVFCAFRSDLKAEKAYTFDDQMIRERVSEATEAGATEIHVVGGLHHQKPFDWYEHKADSQSWIDIHRCAHRLGLRTNATMLYGHLEASRHRVDHLCQLRDLQDETGGFQTFIPLAFHPENTGHDNLKLPSGLVDLRVMALSRVMLDNFDHIKAYWIMLGEKTAQVALSFGADDLDGTVVHELIYHDAGAETPEGLTVDQLHRLIREAGREPFERDTLYRRVVRDGHEWSIEEPVVAGGERVEI